LFLFSGKDSNDKILVKFNLWARYFFPQYFTSLDAGFHREIDLNNLLTYRGEVLEYFTDIAFRGAAKTARTKLFLAFCILNDDDHLKKYIKVLCADVSNSRQIVTDIYNMMIYNRVTELYPEVFQKTSKKREETMQAFTTSTRVKLTAGTVGSDQRGALQEDSRPDLIWYEDFENRKTLRSAKDTKAIWDNMEEARTGLAKGGTCIYTCNYISEMGNVHALVTKTGPKRKVLIIPILTNQGLSAWPERYSLQDIAQMKEDDDDFEGERLCKPSASRDIFFDRSILERMPVGIPIRELAGYKIYREYNPTHSYGSGHDVAGGVGLDSSTSVMINFTMNPAQVVGVFASNSIKPDIFGDELLRESRMFGNPIVGIEKNNHGHATIARAKQLGIRLYETQRKDVRFNTDASKEYGWHTNALTKPKMLFALVKAIEDGILLLNDPDLIAEFKSYSRNDMMDSETDPRLTTRHFDLLIACAIAWQMKDFAFAQVEEKHYDDPAFDPEAYI